jgi:phenylalanyl-tRNA synthetase beta chain
MGADDAVLDFEVTANRPDCMSVIGMAREVATAYGLPLRRPAASGASLSGSPGGAEGSAAHPLKTVAKSDVEIAIVNPELCPRYAGAVADVTVGPSPQWMQARLQAAGVRPISNIVDITNYVLLELGQPMHAFDLARLSGAQILVRTAAAGESIKTLDGQTRELAPDMLVIADAERPVAVAGVMGGADSEVTTSTPVIVFESACFNALSVRRTSKKLGLKTEASMRFERGVDPRLPVTAMERACALLEMTGAGRARGTVVDRNPARIESIKLGLRRAKISGLLGTGITDAEVQRILESLGFALREAADGWEVTVPTWRVDAVREVDLIEEVARHYGFDRLPSTFPALTAAPPPIDPRIARARHLRTVMTAAGFSEAMTFGFVAEPAAKAFAREGDLVPITNPLSENFAVLRPSALPSLIDAVAHNRRREQRDVRLFDIGARFSRTHGERRSVACVWTGAAAGDHWGAARAASISST